MIMYRQFALYVAYHSLLEASLDQALGLSVYSQLVNRAVQTGCLIGYPSIVS